MKISLLVLHKGESRIVQLSSGQTIADALQAIGYPRQGHEYWRAWIGGSEVPLHTVAHDEMAVAITHTAAGNPEQARA